MYIVDGHKGEFAQGDDQWRDRFYHVPAGPRCSFFTRM
jgi:hypothetical protein